LLKFRKNRFSTLKYTKLKSALLDNRYPVGNDHGDIKETFKGVFFVTGSVVMAPGIVLSRIMVILRKGESLTLIIA